MKLKYFGDSYDIVKKSLLVWLAEFGPWSAHPMFTHQVIDAEATAFETFLGIPLVSTEVLRIDVDRRSYLEPCEGCRSIFVDPDTGVRLTKRNGRRAPEFVFGDELVVLASARPTGLVMTFDQSLARGSERSQVLVKLEYFASRGIYGFAYVSHASFMVLAQSKSRLNDAREKIVQESGLPAHRIVSYAA